MACAASQIDSQNANSTSTSATVSGSGVSVVSRPPRITMEGVGARVIRGPDWKWGKQVIYNKCVNPKTQYEWNMLIKLSLITIK